MPSQKYVNKLIMWNRIAEKHKVEKWHERNKMWK